MTIISCSRGAIIVPWENFQYVLDKNGRSDVIIDPSKHHYMLYTTEPNLRSVLSHTPEGKIDKIIHENPSWQCLIYCKMEPSDSLKLMQLLNKHNCSFPVILDPNGEFLNINKIESTYTLIGYMCNKNGKVCGASIIGTSQSFFDQEFRNAKYKISIYVNQTTIPKICSKKLEILNIYILQKIKVLTLNLKL